MNLRPLSLGMAAAGLVGLAPAAMAQTTIGFNDFDTAVSGTDYISQSFTPDNSGNAGFGGAPGVFPGSNFDVWGVTNRDVLFDVADDSIQGIGNPNEFENDHYGFAGFGPNSPGNFVLATDTENGDNPSGAVSATWRFDISGYENIQISLDAVAYGDHEENDSFVFTASIDGGSSQNIFDFSLTPTQNSANITYANVMDDGQQYDRYDNVFWDSGAHAALVAVGPSGGFDYHPDDDGVTNGDAMANDGFIPLIGALSTVNTAAYFEAGDADGNGVTDPGEGFTNTEENLLVDPLTEQNTGTQLDNEFQTVTNSLTGTGNILTLTVNGFTGGSREIFAFDNILIEGDLITILLGDMNGDGDVNNLDINPFALALTDESAYTSQFPGIDPDVVGDINGDDVLNNLDINPFADLLTGGGSSITTIEGLAALTVPEPTTLTMFAAAWLLWRRRTR